LLEALLIVAAILVLLPLAGFFYQKLGAVADFRRHPSPGRLVDVGGHRLHLLDSGAGHPTVLFESGLPGSVLSWFHVQQELARLVRVVSYDRAGLGWSDAGPEPRTAGRIVDELHRLLELANVPPPYILVGHSFGGLTTRLFASRFPDEVAGLVLVDPVGPEEWSPLSERERRRLAGGAKLCRRAALLARFGVTRLVGLLVRAGAHRLARFAVLFISNGVLADSGSTIGPLAKLPAEQRSIVGMFWMQPKFYAAMAGQVESLPESASQVARAADTLDPKPVIVISAANTEPARLAEQIATARLSSCGKHLVARKSSHWVQLDEPELVIGAVLGVIAELGRAPAPPSKPGGVSRTIIQ
jgi:pimeloyl-ACP methyl ester carboxylesterase